jgi:mannose-6-phosphate isomerase-like protein (cupin superfamily)
MRAHLLLAFALCASFSNACAAPPKCSAVASPQPASTTPSATPNPGPAQPPHAHTADDGHTHDAALAHDAPHPGIEAPHSHDVTGAPPPAPAPEPRGIVVAHDTLRHFTNNGNDLVGIATPSLGAQEHEVWRSTIAVGSHTPLHRHESEEIFVFLRGKGRAEIGGQAVEFSAPATVIAPAGVPHQFFNTGSEPTDAIVVVRLHSTIEDAQGNPMQLPWRR